MKFTRRLLRESFSTAEAARLAGLTPRQLDHWDRRGFLKPSVAAARGYGSARRYSFADIVRLRVAARLRASGVGLPRVRRWKNYGRRFCVPNCVKCLASAPVAIASSCLPRPPGKKRKPMRRGSARPASTIS